MTETMTYPLRLPRSLKRAVELIRSPFLRDQSRDGLCEVMPCARVRGYLELNLPIRSARENATASTNDSLPN
jgi:hypothetical protein